MLYKAKKNLLTVFPEYTKAPCHLHKNSCGRVGIHCPEHPSISMVTQDHLTVYSTMYWIGKGADTKLTLKIHTLVLQILQILIDIFANYSKNEKNSQ